MDRLVVDTLRNIEHTLDSLEAYVPHPEAVEVNGKRTLRYKEKNIYQAIVQKLARVVSGLNAALMRIKS